MQQVLQLIKANVGGSYQQFMEKEGVPIHEAIGGIEDVAELDLKPWARMGGAGAFVKMVGTNQGEVGIYVVEVPGGGALEPEKHLYDEELFIIKGRGLTEVWQDGGSKVSFEWGEGSVFAPPLNTWHRLVNGSRDPALVLGITTAPRMMNLLHDNDFVFDCDYAFADRFGGQPDYFTAGEDRITFGAHAHQSIWETNFIPDSQATFLDDFEQKVAGGQLTGYRMGKYFPNGHISEWAVGGYHKAHYHGPGAVLLGLKGEGYVLLWPYDLGLRPYQDGHGDQVLTIKWGPRSIYTPPDGWYHQHFNTGNEPARHIAVYGRDDRPEIVRARDFGKGADIAVVVSSKEGGTMIDYEDEDPEVRRHFEEVLGKKGLKSAMPPVNYS